jgi:hypothetical protein
MGPGMQRSRRIGWLGWTALVCSVACGHTSKHPGDNVDERGGAPSAEGGASATGVAGSSKGGRASAGTSTGGKTGVAGALPTPGGAGGADDCADVDTANDPDNCGECGKHCGLQNACVAGKCTADLQLLAELPGCGSLMLQREPGQAAPGVLWALGSKSGILSRIELPEAGDGKPKTFASGLAGAKSFTLEFGLTVNLGKSLVRVDTMTAEKAPFVDDAGGITGYGFNLGEPLLYFSTGNTIKSFDLGPAPAAPAVVWTSPDLSEPRDLVAFNDTLLYASSGSSNIESLVPFHGEHATIAKAQGQLLSGHRSLQLDQQNDDTYVYWAGSNLERVGLSDATHAVEVIANPIGASPIIAYAIQGADMMAYIATKDGSLEKMSFDSDAEATSIARNLPSVTSVVLDDFDVYLASGCKILKSSRLDF